MHAYIQAYILFDAMVDIVQNVSNNIVAIYKNFKNMTWYLLFYCYF